MCGGRWLTDTEVTVVLPESAPARNRRTDQDAVDDGESTVPVVANVPVMKKRTVKL